MIGYNRKAGHFIWRLGTQPYAVSGWGEGTLVTEVSAAPGCVIHGGSKGKASGWNFPQKFSRSELITVI